MKWEDTGLEWVIASPHIPHKHSAYYYPVTGILGELGLRVGGRGLTHFRFRWVAAPWIKAQEFADAMNRLELPGIIFRPIFFTPFYGTLKGENCQGVQIHIVDFKKAHLSSVQFYIMQEIARLYPIRKYSIMPIKKDFPCLTK
jgi:uncharacterized protein YbbC (DUF1343 family)